jgi:hypothetical protein
MTGMEHTWYATSADNCDVHQKALLFLYLSYALCYQQREPRLCYPLIVSGSRPGGLLQNRMLDPFAVSTDNRPCPMCNDRRGMGAPPAPKVQVADFQINNLLILHNVTEQIVHVTKRVIAKCKSS